MIYVLNFAACVSLILRNTIGLIFHNAVTILFQYSHILIILYAEYGLHSYGIRDKP